MTAAALAIEVGNSRIKMGLFDHPAPADGLPVCRSATAIPVDTIDPTGTIGRWLDEQGGRPDVCLLGGVNPPVLARIRDRWNGSSGELRLIERPAAPLLVNRTDAPERVGADRLFDAVAANRLRRPAQPAIVVDSGTATTVNLIDGKGAFHGGAIIAGFGLMANALHQHTAQLPKIDVVELATAPGPLGRNTADAIRSGLYWGLVGSVKELVSRFTQIAVESAHETPLLVLTGGAAPLLVSQLPTAHYEPVLTLQGLILSA